MLKTFKFLLLICSFLFSQDLNAIGLNKQKNNGIDTIKKLFPENMVDPSFIELFNASQLSPFWRGNREKFKIKDNLLHITGDYKSPIVLSFPNRQIDNTLWEIGLEINTKISTSNNIRVFLAVDKQDPLIAHKGYHLQIIGSQDQHTYELWQQDNLVRENIFRSAPVDNKNGIFRARLRVVHDKNGYWKIYADEYDTGEFTVLTSSKGDSSAYSRTYRNSQHAGLLINYAPANQQDFTIHYFLIKPLAKDSVDKEPLPYTPRPRDILINEVLPNPKPGGTEFVEIYNNSDRDYDLQDLQIARIIAPDSLVAIYPISNEFSLIAPREYRLLTKDPSLLQDQYYTPNPTVFIKMPSMPQMNNKSGIIALISSNMIIDRLDYNEDLHNPFIKNPKGVSLERRSFESETNAIGNFTSASAAVGYATPGYKNSQHENLSEHQNDVWLVSKTFSPDQDGFEDNLQINYRFRTDGAMANIYIYNDQGSVVRRLFRNHLLSTEGTLLWDGLNDQGQLLPVGIYIVYFEVYNAIDSVKTYRLSCVLSTKF